jgi:hypothetical protein
MTLAKASGSNTRPSKAARNLEFAQGKTRVPLSELSSKELDQLVSDQLKMDTKHLHGFQELRDALRSRGDYLVEVVPGAFIQGKGFHSEDTFGFKSHVIRVCRGALTYEPVFKRLETGEETTDHSVYIEWGQAGYVHRYTQSLLFMRRLEDKFARRDDILVHVEYECKKVIGQKRYDISAVSVCGVPVMGFSKHFGKKAPDVARDLIWELSTIYRQSVQAMENKVLVLAEELRKRERLAESIS